MSYSFCQLCQEQYPSQQLDAFGFCFNCEGCPDDDDGCACDGDDKCAYHMTCGCQYGEGPCGKHKNRRVCHKCFETYTMIPNFSYETECDPCARKVIADFVEGK